MCDISWFNTETGTWWQTHTQQFHFPYILLIRFTKRTSLPQSTEYVWHHFTDQEAEARSLNSSPECTVALGARISTSGLPAEWVLWDLTVTPPPCSLKLSIQTGSLPGVLN